MKISDWWRNTYHDAISGIISWCFNMHTVGTFQNIPLILTICPVIKGFTSGSDIGGV